jgi:hypothetical protein
MTADSAAPSGQEEGREGLTAGELLRRLRGPGELAAAEAAALDARRAGPDGRQGEHVAEELAAALTLTGRAAAWSGCCRARRSWPPGSSTAPAPP